MPFCSGCGSEVADVKFCPKCGAPVAAAESPSEAAGAAAPPNPPYAQSGAAAANDDNVMGALAYVTIIPAIIFLIIEPYKNRRFVRFHSFQCLFLAAALFVLNILNVIIGFIPVVNFLTFITAPLLFLGAVVVWVIVLIKAYQGVEYRLPVIGDMAAKQV